MTSRNSWENCKIMVREVERQREAVRESKRGSERE